MEDKKGHSPELWQKMADLGWQGRLSQPTGGTDRLEVLSPGYPWATVGVFLVHLITEVALHVGQIDYLSGVHRGLRSMDRQ